MKRTLLSTTGAVTLISSNRNSQTTTRCAIQKVTEGPLTVELSRSACRGAVGSGTTAIHGLALATSACGEMMKSA